MKFKELKSICCANTVLIIQDIVFKKMKEKKIAWLKFCYDLCIIYKVLYSDILLVNI